MQKFSGLVRVALFSIVSLILPDTLRAAEPLRFVVWNLEWFPGKRPTASAEEADAHMKKAQDVLKQVNPDIFVGVEIRDWAAFHELVSVVPGLTEHPDGGLLMVYGNHFKSNGGSDTPEGAKNVADMRNNQAAQLLAHREKVEKAFVGQKILGWIASGDFNTNHDGQFPLCNVVKLMTEGGYFNTWAATPKEERLTWIARPDSRFESTTFDYIFTQGIQRSEAFVIEMPEGLSDHPPVGLRVSKP